MRAGADVVERKEGGKVSSTLFQPISSPVTICISTRGLTKLESCKLEWRPIGLGLVEMVFWKPFRRMQKAIEKEGWVSEVEIENESPGVEISDLRALWFHPRRTQDVQSHKGCMNRWMS